MWSRWAHLKISIFHLWSWKTKFSRFKVSPHQYFSYYCILFHTSVPTFMICCKVAELWLGMIRQIDGQTDWWTDRQMYEKSDISRWVPHLKTTNLLLPVFCQFPFGQRWLIPKSRLHVHFFSLIPTIYCVKHDLVNIFPLWQKHLFWCSSPNNGLL